MAEPELRVVWEPQPGPQTALINCPVEEIFYGGARGGGKTDGMIGKNAIKADKYGRAQKGIFFRKELPQLDEAISRCKEIYSPLGWQWFEQKKTFKHPNGATLKFRPLEREQDGEKYQGHNYTDIYFEELTNYPTDKVYNRLRATLRSAQGVPCQLHATGNPGGPGHHWVKQRFIDPAPQGYQVLEEELPDGFVHHRVFIPAKVQDNPALLDNDPGYVSNLRLAGSDALVRAWLEGDWNVIEGAFFDCWSERMVIYPFAIPDHWTKFRSFDWGSASPFSVGWWAIVEDIYLHKGQKLPRGALVRYREWYGAKGPNLGLKLTAEQVTAGILEKEDEETAYSVADPAIFKEDGGPSIAERMRPIYFRKADNTRVPRDGHIGGWDQMRARMIGTDDVPMIYCFNTCVDSIRTIPLLQHDADKPEDLDTNSEDHAADEWRYACMSRPWLTVVQPEVEPEKDAWGRYKRQSGSWKTN